MDTKLFFKTLSAILGDNWPKDRDFRELMEEELLKAAARQDKARVEEIVISTELLKHLMFEKFQEELKKTPSPSVALHQAARWGDSIAPVAKIGTHLVEDLRPVVAESFEKLLIPEAVILTEDLFIYHIPVAQQSIRKKIVAMPTLCNLVGYPVLYPLKSLYADPDLFCLDCVLRFHAIERSLTEEISDFLNR